MKHTSDTYAESPQYRQLLPQVLTDAARTRPEAIWAEFPTSPSDYGAGFTKITYKTLANAVDGLAWCLEAQLGKGIGLPTLAYLGPSDVRYPMVVLACIKAGYKALLTSPRNSVAAHKNLMEKLDCQTVLTTDPVPQFVKPLLEARTDVQVGVVQIPSLHKLMVTDYESYPFDKTYESAYREPAFCLHTSGSTGLPKPLVYTQEWITVVSNVAVLEAPDGFVMLDSILSGNRTISLLPPFHIAGFVYSIVRPLYNEVTVIFPSPAAPPTSSTLSAILDQVQADWSFVSPVHLEHLSKDGKLLSSICGRLKMLVYSGGSLPTPAGNVVAAKIRIQSFLGSSECGSAPLMISNTANAQYNWNATQVHPYAGAEFRFRDNGFYEHVIVKKAELAPWQAVFAMFPEIDEYPTRDLFSPHPTQKDAWLYQGRDDDIIVFLTGEKTCPLTFEAAVQRHQKVKGALVFGQQKFEAGLLIELDPESTQKVETGNFAEVLDSIWPMIEEANLDAPAHARVSRSHVIFANSDKPFARAGKGTIQRHASMGLYYTEIEACYAANQIDFMASHENLESSRTRANGTARSSSAKSLNAVTIVLRDALAQIAPTAELTDKQDFFAAGIDSQQVLRLSRQLQQEFADFRVDPALIYSHPSLETLAKALCDTNIEQTTAQINGLSDRSQFRSLQQKYAHYMEVLADGVSFKLPQSRPRQFKRAVLLTGSTGSIGSYLLHTLMQSPDIGHIYCLNRSNGSDIVQRKRNQLRDAVLPTSFPPSKVTFLTGDITNVTYLGLSSETYQKLLSEVSLIVHNAWPVDFVQTLTSFGPQLAGLVHLMLLTARCTSRASIVFMSSQAAVMQLKGEGKTVPEEPTHSTESATEGYGESKLLGERLLHRASEYMGIDTAVVRIGQVAGARHSSGGWNPSEWVPRILMSSLYLGVLPEELGSLGEHIDWIPIDDLAKSLVEIGLNETMPTSDGAEQNETATHHVYNIVSPRATSWEVLRAASAEALSTKKPVSIVPHQEWLNRVRESAEIAVSGISTDTNDHDEFARTIQANPAIMLEDFLTGLYDDSRPFRMETNKACKISKTLNQLNAVSADEMLRWTLNLIQDRNAKLSTRMHRHDGDLRRTLEVSAYQLPLNIAHEVDLQTRLRAALDDIEELSNYHQTPPDSSAISSDLELAICTKRLLIIRTPLDPSMGKVNSYM